MTRYHHLQAWALVVLGAWLILSPFFVPGYAPRSLAAGNSVLIGTLAVGMGLAGFFHARDLDRWIDMALGIGSWRDPRR
ncbi:MAG TPA: SPW repeat protein [Usitatibacter sp.]|nr:SPW repeat protein [Usitatibacter sp.]